MQIEAKLQALGLVLPEPPELPARDIHLLRMGAGPWQSRLHRRTRRAHPAWRWHSRLVPRPRAKSRRTCQLCSQRWSRFASMSYSPQRCCDCAVIAAERLGCQVRDANAGWDSASHP